MNPKLRFQNGIGTKFLSLIQETIEIEKPTLFKSRFSQDHKNKPKMQANPKSPNLAPRFYCVKTSGKIPDASSVVSSM